MLGQAATGIPALAYLRARGHARPALAVLQWEDADADSLGWRRKRVHRLLRAAGGRRLPGGIADHWMGHRFRGPYQRDHLMDRGMFVETLETATRWDNLGRLYAATRAAIVAELGEHCLVQCHVSHLYAGGASLYFTLLSRADAEPLEQWRRVKAAASDAIIKAGGTITHHHAVGTDHLPWLGRELGDLGVRMLRALKTELDPAGILNPGKLVPADDSAAQDDPTRRGHVPRHHAAQADPAERA